MNTRARLLRRLADGRFHSGTVLGAHLGVTRAAIAKAVRHLAATGLEIHAVPGKGYRLEAPIEPLERRRLQRELRVAGVTLGERLIVLAEVDSTSSYLLRELATRPVSGLVCVAEAQSQGRGRRGRRWQAAAFQDLMLSVSWRLPTGPGPIAGLSLAAGVAIVQALRAYGVSDAGLKWPNDVLWRGRKLAGVLIDVQGEASGPCWVVLGVGINGRLDARVTEEIDQPWVDLHTITGAPIRRNELAARVIAALFDMFERFARAGFVPFRAAWQDCHLYHGQPVRVISEHREVRGIARGVNDAGALKVIDADGREHYFYSGDVSLRALA